MSLAMKRRSQGLWSGRIISRIFTALLVLVFLMPLITVAYLAWVSEGGTIAVPRYVMNSIALVLLVCFFSFCIGLGAAFCVVRFEFRGRRWLEALLILPLALPAFMMAYALVEFFDYAGPLQHMLRQSGLDWSFPKFRSLGGAVMVLSFALYPYVYIYARQGLLKQSRHTIDAARVMGLSPRQVFFRVELPSLRPALAVGLSLVALEVLADFGTVDHFGVETLSTGIFTAWLQAHQLGVAVRMALILALMALGLLALESYARRNASYVSGDANGGTYPKVNLRGWRAFLVWALGIIPFLMGFVLPIGVFLSLLDWREIPVGEWSALAQSVALGVIAAILICAMALWVNRNGASRLIQLVGMIGYALPGAVLGIGVLLPLSLFDHKLADWREAMGAEQVGLMLTGSIFAMLLAYFIRFFALGNGAIHEGKSRLSPNLVGAARVLGQSRMQAFWRVERPLLMRPIFAAMLLVFVDVVKELPATLILRPFGVETLATRLYQAAALEDLGQASLSALLIAATGMISVFVLIKFSE